MKHPLALAVLIGLSTSGCSGLVPGGVIPGSADLAAIGKAIVNDVTTSLQSDLDLNVATLLTDDTSLKFTSQALGGNLSTLRQVARPAKPTIPQDIQNKLKQQFDKQREKVKSQLENRKNALTKEVVKTETTNADGTKTIKYEMKVTGKAGTETHIVEKTLDAGTSALIALDGHIERTHKNGQSMVVDRTRDNAADGSWTSTYKATFTRKDAKTKTVDWTRTGTVDGLESASGKITRFDGSTVTISITKSADGSVVTKSVDTKNKVEAEVKKDDDGTSAEATITTDGKALDKLTVADTAAVEPSEN